MGALWSQWLSMLKDYPPEQSRRLIQSALDADPTRGHVCVAWILRQIRDEYICLPEQAGKVRDVLAGWQRFKVAGALNCDRDINHHNYYALRRLVEEAGRRQSLRKEEKQIKAQGAETIYEDSRYRIIRVRTADAAVALARGTRWCTRSRWMASRYLLHGPLHIVFRDGVRYAQLHIRDGELKNELDDDLQPDRHLAEVLKGVFRPRTLAQALGLSLVLGRPLLARRRERFLFRCWFADYDDEIPNDSIELARRYFARYYTQPPARRRRLAKLTREALAEERLDVACRLQEGDILPMRELFRPLRRAIRSCYHRCDFQSLHRFLSHFQGLDLHHSNVSELEGESIDLLWQLLRMKPSTGRALVSARLADEADQRAREDFLAIFAELWEDWKEEHVYDCLTTWCP